MSVLDKRKTVTIGLILILILVLGLGVTRSLTVFAVSEIYIEPQGYEDPNTHELKGSYWVIVMAADMTDQVATYKFTAEEAEGGDNTWNGKTIIPEASSAANLDTYFIYGATTMAEVDSGTDWDDDNNEIDANATLSDTDEDLYIKIVCGASNVAYGMPMYTIAADGEFQTRISVAIVSTNMTSVSAGELATEGWTRVSDSRLTNEAAFYKVVGPFIPSKGESFTVDIKIPLDTSAAGASEVGLFHIFLIDFQLESNVAAGSTTTSIPTGYGMVTGGAYGIDAMIFARTWTVSSGVADNEIMRAYITNA